MGACGCCGRVWARMGECGRVWVSVGACGGVGAWETGSRGRRVA